MNKLLCAAIAAVLLSGCDKPAADAPASAAPETAASAPADPAVPAAPQQPADAGAPLSQPKADPASPAADAAAEKATDDAIDNALGDHVRYREAIDKFQKAVAAKDAAAVAELVQYPFAATIDGKKRKIEDARGFVANYDRIVTAPIADAIVKQKYADLFVNYKGVMFGSGEAWLNGICEDEACKAFDVKVTAIQPGA